MPTVKASRAASLKATSRRLSRQMRRARTARGPSGDSPTRIPLGMRRSTRVSTMSAPALARARRWKASQDLRRLGPISGRGALPLV